MTSTSVPLIDLFFELQRRGFSLGLPDYLLALEALAKGFGNGSREELSFICQTLWAKSPEEQQQVNEALNTLLPRKLTEAELEKLVATERKPTESRQHESASKSQTPAQSETQNSNNNFDTTFSWSKAPKGVSTAVPLLKPERLNPNFDLIGNLPVTKRQMKHAWRYYRRMQRRGPQFELDVAATIEQTHRQGVLVKPVLLPRRCNQAQMLILKDEGGSMTPFGRVTQALLDSAKQSGLARISILFFRNVPTNYFYRDRTLNFPEPCNEVIRRFAGAGVLIISDGGAARGSLNQRRLEQTINFVQLLKGFTLNIAWLNPVPEVRWAGTTADAIRHKCALSMFTLDRAGLNAAVDVMRGREK